MFTIVLAIAVPFFLALAIVYDSERVNPISKEDNGKALSKKNAAGEQAKPDSKAKPNWLGGKINKFQTQLQQYRTKKRERTASDTASERLVIATWAIALLAIATIVVGYWQYEAISGQLEQMQEEKRPWIIPDINIVGLRFYKNGRAEITYDMSYRNIGNSPANVNVYVTALLLTEKMIFESSKEEEFACDKASVKNGYNITVFPDHSAPRLVGGSGQGRAYIDNPEYASAWPTPGRGIFRLVGCIGYVYSFNWQRQGKTGFSYNIDRHITGDTLGHPFSPVEGDVPLEDINFYPNPFGGDVIR